MSNASLKEQLQAMVSPLSDKPAASAQRKVPDKSVETQKAMHKTQKPYQVGKNGKPKPKWLDYAFYGVELLKAYFPLCFKATNEVMPLKKGIKEDLVKYLSTLDTIIIEDKACMIKSLAYYVNTAAYHKSVVEGALRVKLDGSPAGKVSIEEAKYSIERQQTKLQSKQTATSTAQIKIKEDVTL
jgi:ProP effector